MNWIGILEEHKSQSKAPESTYKFNQVDLNWTCELSIPWCPVAFGGRNATFQKKQAAKADAAKKAVEWLLENGIMGKNGGVTLSWAAFEKRMKAAMDPDMAGEGNEAANHIDEMINDALQDDTEEFDRSTMAETVHREYPMRPI